MPRLAANPEAELVIPRANRAFVIERLGAVEKHLVEIDAGESTSIGNITLHGIPAAHNTVERDENGQCKFLGFVAQVGGLTFYHSGDTLMHDGLVAALEPFSPDIAGNLDGREAAELARAIHARLAIPHHFDLFAFNTATPELFETECRRVGQPYRVLGNGEGIDL